MTSKSDPRSDFSSFSSSSLQRMSELPVKYHGEPLSARIIPYRCIATRMTRIRGLNPLMSKSAFSRTRRPIGGRLEEVPAPAWWRAGYRCALRVTGAVNRMAWSIAPAATSS